MRRKSEPLSAVLVLASRECAWIVRASAATCIELHSGVTRLSAVKPALENNNNMRVCGSQSYPRVLTRVLPETHKTFRAKQEHVSCNK